MRNGCEKLEERRREEENLNLCVRMSELSLCCMFVC